jgi:hypothetical protein
MVVLKRDSRVEESRLGVEVDSGLPKRKRGYQGAFTDDLDIKVSSARGGVPQSAPGMAQVEILVYTNRKRRPGVRWSLH